MQLQYRKVGETLIWDLKEFDKIMPENIEKLHGMVEKAVVLNAYKDFSESFSPERVKLINNLLLYLSRGFRAFDTSFREDKRKVAYLALLELHDFKIELKDIQNRVKVAAQYYRFAHKQVNPSCGEHVDIDSLAYDIDSSGKLEEAMELEKERKDICYIRNSIKDVFLNNPYGDENPKPVEEIICIYIPSPPRNEQISNNSEAEETKKPQNKKSSWTKTLTFPGITLFQTERHFEMDTDRAYEFLDIKNSSQIEDHNLSI